jgi:hypothetical protein
LRLSYYAKPESGRFKWYAQDGQLRKGDANVFRLFVERAHTLLRESGRFAQVLPDAVYMSSTATGLRQRLLREGLLERCYVFENRKEIFPIHRSAKVVLLTGQRGGGPTQHFRASFLAGKNAAGRDRAVGLDTLPGVLADLELHAPELAVDQIRALAPETWSFPELQTALDAEIAAQCAVTLPALNLDERGWAIRYSRGLHADEEAWRFKSSSDLEKLGARRVGLRWKGPISGQEWWPLVEGQTFYQLEFPTAGNDPRYWVDGNEVRRIEKFIDDTGRSVFEQYRVAWRDTTSATNERSAIAAVIPPRAAEKHTAPSVWGGLLDESHTITLAAIISSFVFDYFARFGGKTHLTHYVLDAVPTPSPERVRRVIEPAAEVVCRSEEFDALWRAVFPSRSRPELDWWDVGERRARIDAEVARAYGLPLEQFAAVLCTFPNIDTIQPMLPGEPKSFVTRDLALLAYCRLTDTEPPDISKLLREIGVDLPDPRREYRLLDARVAAARKLGAIPYRPTPRGGKASTDPALIEAVQGVLGIDALTVAEIAEAAEDEEKTVAAVLKSLEKQGLAYAEGIGKKRRYYVIEDD